MGERCTSVGGNNLSQASEGIPSGLGIAWHEHLFAQSDLRCRSDTPSGSG